MTSGTMEKEEKGRKRRRHEPTVSTPGSTDCNAVEEVIMGKGKEEKTQESDQGIKEEIPQLPATRSGYQIFAEKIEYLQSLLGYMVGKGLPIDMNTLRGAVKDVNNQADNRNLETFIPEESEALSYTLLDCAYQIATHDKAEKLSHEMSKFISNHLGHDQIMEWLNYRRNAGEWQIIPCICDQGYNIAKGEEARRLQRQFEFRNKFTFTGIVLKGVTGTGTEILNKAVKDLIEVLRYNKGFPDDSVGLAIAQKASSDFFDQIKVRIGETIDDLELPYRIIDCFCIGENIPEDGLRWLSYYLTRDQLATYLAERHPRFRIEDYEEGAVGFMVIKNRSRMGRRMDIGEFFSRMERDMAPAESLIEMLLGFQGFEMTFGE